MNETKYEMRTGGDGEQSTLWAHYVILKKLCSSRGIIRPLRQRVDGFK
jgi:hypothetical protein